MSKLEDYLPEKKEKVLVQCWLDEELVDRVANFKDKKKLSWSELLYALFQRLKEEEKL